MSGIDYSDSTPDVAYTYDRRGRLSTVIRNGITNTLAYNDANQLLSESYAGGTLNGLSVHNSYDNYLRRTQLQPKNGGTPLSTATYSYNPQSGRLELVSDSTHSATYSYLANSPLVEHITFKQNDTVRMTTTKQYDKLHPVRCSMGPEEAGDDGFAQLDKARGLIIGLSHGVNRLLSISSIGGASSASPISFAYAYNLAREILGDWARNLMTEVSWTRKCIGESTAIISRAETNQRYRVTLADGSYWFYEYDALGQLRSGKKYWSDGTPVLPREI